MKKGIVIIMIIVLLFVIKELTKGLPKFKIVEVEKDFISFYFDGVYYRLMKNMNDASFKTNSKYVLVALSDANGAVFKLYDADQVVKVYPIVWFKK